MYAPINYGFWNFSGEGKNVAHLLLPIEQKVWNMALPFQDKRDDTGHVEFVTYFALELLKQVVAERRIVIPAAILHDTGWSQMSREEMAQFYLPNWRDFEPRLRAKHQEEGVKLAGRILREAGYLQGFMPHISEIISQHDTREGFFDSEDGVVRDADKLWLYSVPCCILSMEKRDFGKSLYSQLVEWLNKKGFFYSETAREIAKVELENSQGWLAEKSIFITEYQTK